MLSGKSSEVSALDSNLLSGQPSEVSALDSNLLSGQPSSESSIIEPEKLSENPLETPILEQSTMTDSGIEQTEKSDGPNLNAQENITESEQMEILNSTNTNNIKSSSVIYLTYDDSEINNISGDELNKLNQKRYLIAKNIKIAMDQLTGVSSNDTLNIYRVRFGIHTTSVEIVINITGEEKLTEDDIKDKIVNTILSKGEDNIKSKLFISELGLLKDIYFDGISKYSQLQSLPGKYKRVMLEMPGIYPENEEYRINFEENIIMSIIEILEESNLEIERIHLERISRIINKSDRVIVQFLIMDGDSGSKTPNQIITEFKNNYNLGESNYSKIHQITNVVFGDPSIILDGSEYDNSYSVSEVKKNVEEVDNTTLNKLEGEYKAVKYYGCELTLDDLKNNLITSSTPLFPDCEINISRYLNY